MIRTLFRLTSKNGEIDMIILRDIYIVISV
jgi:hypothetical protein